MSKISNAELHKLISEFKSDFNIKCDTMTKANEDGNKILAEKIDSFSERLDKFDQRLDKIDETNVVYSKKFEELESQIEEVDAKIDEGINSVVHRVSTLEGQIHRCQEVEFPETIRVLREENAQLKDELKEEIENSTNRQLRRTLIFRNIPETKDYESYMEVKTLLAQVVSTNTDIVIQEVLDGIERAHREPKRADGTRNGKRKIFAAFLNWELAQRIIDEFRKRCIGDRTFQIYVDQMYGPLTTQRRNLAFESRKKLKEQGVITGGYVEFPAKLMVNIAGDIGEDGKKKYRLHTNFSTQKIEKQ